MIVNPKVIQNKAKTHKVVELVPFKNYLVVSGKSNNEYDVWIFTRTEKTIAATCSCNWGKYNPRSACSHVQAAVDAMFPDYKGSAWSRFEEAHKQHRKMQWIGNGVIMTLRKT